MDSISFYFLLLIAIVAGWLMGRFMYPRNKIQDKSHNDLFEDYFVGLNYLLNDEPDEAIDTFINALEINSETIETHLALGALLRRRGKVDKAIKVHHALLARPELEQGFSGSARLQLAQDYISAGLLDRAERLLNEVLNENKNFKWEALRFLITIYQTEKEWEQAISSSSMMLANPTFKKDIELRAAAAHYCCEIAEQLLESNNDAGARASIKRAFTFDRRNIRASFLLAKIEQRRGKFKAAIKELVRILASNPDFIGQLLQPLSDCYEQLGSSAGFEKLLRDSLLDSVDVNVMLTLTELIQENSGSESALSFLKQQLSINPSMAGLLKLLGLQIGDADDKSDAGESLRAVQKLLKEMLQKSAEYQCNHCGFESRKFYWMCPSCKKWDRIKPMAQSALR